MDLQIRTRGFTLTRALGAHVRRRLAAALGPFANRVQTVTVRLADVNGPRGGHDKQCLVQVVFPGMAPLVASDTSDDLYSAISRASQRLGQGAQRLIGRRTRMSRVPARLSVA